VEQRDLVTRAGRGDHDAFAALAAANVTRLDAAARLILRDRELARDAVQETLVRAWRDLRSLRDPGKFDSWLHRLLVHACMDELRRRRRRPTEVELMNLDIAGTPDDTARLLADRDELDRVLASLAPEHRALVVLHYYLGLPVPEAAAALGISLGAAKSRLHRAIGLLRRAFGVDDDVPIAVEAAPSARGEVA
jgi:RNA polymerase sigma-70 factor (ECF subfamily)